jgi:hypothetical protein
VAILTPAMRRELERAVERGRVAAEAGARSAVARLGVVDARPGAHLTDDERRLRIALRARAGQLGDPLERAAAGQTPCRLVVQEVAYEQWHRLLFARFLEANQLLRHPEFEVPVSLAECEELARDLGEPDGWSVAARFAAEILPGIFKPTDPCVRVRLAREDLLALERVVTDLPAELFTAEDALGWVYQFWQSRAKAEVNASGRKIGGADLSPVTQLFTENYMVRFLLENSLGSWWAARHPDSPLLAGYNYLRRAEDGTPAGGAFETWPQRVADVTVMDPCCGSGHFLVAAFGMLWRMRAEEEGLTPPAAQDAVLRENLFGLELDPRCTQLGMFALALEAWKQGGYRQLPVPKVACSGIPAKAPLDEWTKLAQDDNRLKSALVRLHQLFADADTLGSLIDPIRAAEDAGLQSVNWEDVVGVLGEALRVEAEASGDPAAEVFGEAAADIVVAADMLSRRYTLIATNVPYLGLQKMPEKAARYLVHHYPLSAQDLATVFIERCLRFTSSGSVALVTPLSWLFLRYYSDMREELVRNNEWNVLAPLGKGAFGSISGHVVQALLVILSRVRGDGDLVMLDATADEGVQTKSSMLAKGPFTFAPQRNLQGYRDTLLALGSEARGAPLANYARSWQGLVTGDVARFIIRFWEVAERGKVWVPYLTAPSQTAEYCGRESYLRWDGGNGSLTRDSGAHNFNPLEALGRRGVLVAQSSLRATLYTGEMFNDASSPVIPVSGDDVLALWAYLSDSQYVERVRQINHKILVGNGYLVKVPFDVEHWRGVAARRYPEGLPEPYSDDATQWLFQGCVAESTRPLQVAVARLLGFRWPDQEPDAVDELVDADGIVCLPAVAGERPAADRVRELLARSYGSAWSVSKLDELLTASGGKSGDLKGWLRDGFFKDHCRVFQNRPFVWHIWDGRRDGFSALVNYHRLDRATLERLSYTTLGWWIDRQRADADAAVAGAEVRLAAARELQRKLALVLEGEPPFDICPRWKSLAEQPLGWDPDLDDGVRTNIRPFVEAGVLRSKFTIHWRKDRGTNADGSERHNDRHYTLAEKRAARAKRGAAQ